jgi:hypothetical protein
MGYHYLPQYYLKGFAISDDYLWSYEKGSGTKYCGQTKGIANITNLYSPKMETFLANKIEAPANRVLDKIRRRDKVTDEDKVVFAKYMSVMLKRVPALKDRLKEMAPDLANKISNGLNQQIDKMASHQPSKAEFYEKGRKSIKAILESYTKSPPDTIWWQNIPPERTPKVTAVLEKMKWTFLFFDEGPSFLTCDNPVFYFKEIGIGRPNSEVTFPISPNIVLIATWKKDYSEGYAETNKQVVREINRRTAYNANRFIFHGQDEIWIQDFVKRKQWQLHKLF